MDTPHPAYQTGGRGYTARGGRVDDIHAHEPKSKARSFLPWLIVAVIAFAIIGWLASRHRGHEEAPSTVPTTQQTTAPANPNTQTTTPAAAPIQAFDGGTQQQTSP
jgi:hypothetical protein